MAAKEFPLSVVIKAIDRVTAPMRTIQSAVGRFGDRMDRMRNLGDRMGLPVIGAAAGRVGTALGGLASRLATVATGLAAVGGAAALTAWQMITSFADTGGELSDVAASIGFTAERLQELRYGAKQTGVESQELDRSMQLLSRNIGKAFKDGKGPVFDLLEGLKVRLRDTNGEFRTAEDMLPEIADGLAGITNPTLRASAAAELFGRSGVKLLPLLNGGSKGLQELAARARELGIVISNEAVGQADEFGDKFDDMKSALTGVRNVVGTALMPVLTDLIEQFTGFITRNQGKIQKWAEEFAKDLPGNIKRVRDFCTELATKVQPLIDGFKVVTDILGPANTVLLAVAGGIGLFLIPAIAACVSAFVKLKVALLTTPLGWFLAAIALIAYAAYKIYKNWGPITDFFKTWWQAVKDVFSAVGDFFSGIWNDVRDGFKDGFINGIINLWRTLNPINMIVRAFTELLPKVMAAVAPLTQKMQGFFRGLVPDWAEGIVGGGLQTSAPIGAGMAPAVGAREIGTKAWAAQQSQALVRLDINGAPRGSRVSSELRGKPLFDLNMGYNGY
jgi:hypothetical protein